MTLNSDLQMTLILFVTYRLVIILLKYISLAIFKVSERFEKPYDSRIGFFSIVQCCSMAFTSILAAMKVLVPLYHWYFSDMQI